jgi:hypothetical protein
MMQQENEVTNRSITGEGVFCMVQVDSDITQEELPEEMFSVQSALRLYNEAPKLNHRLLINQPPSKLKPQSVRLNT